MRSILLVIFYYQAPSAWYKEFPNRHRSIFLLKKSLDTVIWKLLSATVLSKIIGLVAL